MDNIPGATEPGKEGVERATYGRGTNDGAVNGMNCERMGQMGDDLGRFIVEYRDLAQLLKIFIVS